MRCCDIYAGKLRHYGDFEARQDTADGGGGVARTWQAYASAVPCSLMPLSGRERLHADKLEAPVTHRLVTRYRDDVLAEHRFKMGNRVFNIRAVIDIEERQQWLELTLEEGVAT